MQRQRPARLAEGERATDPPGSPFPRDEPGLWAAVLELGLAARGPWCCGSEQNRFGLRPTVSKLWCRGSGPLQLLVPDSNLPSPNLVDGRIAPVSRSTGLGAQCAEGRPMPAWAGRWATASHVC